jgi:hypothetical protein
LVKQFSSYNKYDGFFGNYFGVQEHKNELRILKFDILTRGTSHTNCDLHSNLFSPETSRISPVSAQPELRYGFDMYSKVSVAKNPGINTRSFGRTKKILCKTKNFGVKTRNSGFQKHKVLGRKNEVSVRKSWSFGSKNQSFGSKTRSFGLKPRSFWYNFRTRNFRKSWLPECFDRRNPKFWITV